MMGDSEDGIFNNDPLYMLSLVGKTVEIQTAENVVHSGVVYVIDPIYKTIVLHTNLQSDEEYGNVFILYHAIKSLKILPHAVKESYLKRIEEPQTSSDNEEKKRLLRKWLEHMRINVSASGNYLKIDDHLVIVPPYGPNNCICNNTIILDRIQKIIASMPEKFDEK